jgi:hypothetical protein
MEVENSLGYPDTSLLSDPNAIVTIEVSMFTVLAAVNNDAVFQITVNILKSSENRCQGKLKSTFSFISNKYSLIFPSFE